jgi:hypothetical protein
MRAAVWGRRQRDGVRAETPLWSRIDDTTAINASTIPRSNLRAHRPVEIGGRRAEKAEDERKRCKKNGSYRTETPEMHAIS